MSRTRSRQIGIGVYPNDLTQTPYASYDISLLPPDQQYDALVAIMDGIDAAYPPPYTNTPPYGEPTPIDEITPEALIDASYLHAADPQGVTDDELLIDISDAYGHIFPAPEWANDGQYYGLGVPPGVPAWDQPFETGHTQIILPNPAAEVGWDEWSGKPRLARVARHENDFPAPGGGKGYNAGTSRGHMVNVAYLQANARKSAQYFTQQHRDLLLSELKKRGVHNVVVQDVPAVTYSDQIPWVDPATSGANDPMLTEAGVL